MNVSTSLNEHYDIIPLFHISLYKTYLRHIGYGGGKISIISFWVQGVPKNIEGS